MAVRTEGWARRGVIGGVGADAVVALLAGAPAAYTYVTNSAEHTYLKVPCTWRQIDQKELESALGVDRASRPPTRGLWLVAYDADTSPSLRICSGRRPSAPAVLVGVKDLPRAHEARCPSTTSVILLTPSPRRAGQADAADPTSQRSGIQLLRRRGADARQGRPRRARRVPLQLRGRTAAMFDQTTYVNDDASKIYMFFVTVLHGVLQEAPAGDQHRGVLLHRQGEAT